MKKPTKKSSPREIIDKIISQKKAITLEINKAIDSLDHYRPREDYKPIHIDQLIFELQLFKKDTLALIAKLHYKLALLSAQERKAQLQEATYANPIVKVTKPAPVALLDMSVFSPQTNINVGRSTGL